MSCLAFLCMEPSIFSGNTYDIVEPSVERKVRFNDNIYKEYFSNKLFLANECVVKQNSKPGERIFQIKKRIELEYAISLGPRTRELLKDFPDEDKPLGPGRIADFDDIALHTQHQLLGDTWMEISKDLGTRTKYGHLLLAVTPENFQKWATTKRCQEEVAAIDSDRMFVYIEHIEEDEGGVKGYIISIDPKNDPDGSSTVRNGRGYILAPNGSYYHGDLCQCFPQGEGTYVYSNGDVYRGGWEDGSFHGFGNFIFANGTSYKGEFKRGQFHGKGIFKDLNGYIFTGEYKNNQKNGIGILRSLRDTKEGYWKNDVFVESLS